MNICQTYMFGYKRNGENILKSLCKAVWTDTPVFFPPTVLLSPPHRSVFNISGVSLQSGLFCYFAESDGL